MLWCYRLLKSQLYIKFCNRRLRDALILLSRIRFWGSWIGTQIGKYWKNGTPFLLIDGSQDNTLGVSIAVSGSDVYLATLFQSSTSPFHETANYWKNGNAVLLSNNAGASSIALSGNDIYVAGHNSSGAMYWKNGIPVLLSKGSGEARSIFIAIQ